MWSAINEKRKKVGHQVEKMVSFIHYLGFSLLREVSSFKWLCDASTDYGHKILFFFADNGHKIHEREF